MTTCKWAVVLLGTDAPKYELARFRASGDAYIYAKDLVAREGMSHTVWHRDLHGVTSIVRKPGSIDQS